MAGIATASPTKNILMTMSVTVFRWAVSAPPRRWPMSSLSRSHRAPTGSTAGTYQSMGWNNPMRRWIDGHFSVWRGMLLDDFYRAARSTRQRATARDRCSPSHRSVIAREVPKDGLQLVAQPADRSPADRSREKQRMISAIGTHSSNMCSAAHRSGSPRCWCFALSASRSMSRRQCERARIRTAGKTGCARRSDINGASRPGDDLRSWGWP